MSLVPVDLEDSDFALEESALASALSEVDGEGWRLNGRVGASTWLRFIIIAVCHPSHSPHTICIFHESVMGTHKIQLANCGTTS